MKTALAWMRFFLGGGVFLSVIESTFSLFVSLQSLCWEPECRLWGSPWHRKYDALEVTLCDIWRFDDILVKTSLWPFFVNIWDFMDPDFQFVLRIAFPFHLPPSDFLIGQLPRAWPFICWLFPLTELSMDALSSGFQLRPDFIWPWDLFCPVLWCLCMLNFSLYLAPFLPILFICSQLFLCSHPSFFNTTAMNYFQAILPFLFLWGQPLGLYCIPLAVQ